VKQFNITIVSAKNVIAYIFFSFTFIGNFREKSLLICEEVYDAIEGGYVPTFLFNFLIAKRFAGFQT